MFASRQVLLPVLVLAVHLSSLPFAFAQDEDGDGEEKQDERDLSVFGQVRVRGEFRDNSDFDADRPDRQRFIGQRTRLGLDVRVNPRVEGRVLAQDARIWGADGTTVDTGLETQSLDILEGYADLRWIWDLPLQIRLGRQQLSYGSERLVGTNDFSLTARTFDAYRFRFEMGALIFDVFSAKLVDTNGPGPPGLPVMSDQDRNFSGAYFSREGERIERLDIYWLRDIDKTHPTTPGEIKRHTFGALGRTALPAALALEVEYGYQTGEAGDPLDIAAQMLVAELSIARKELRDLQAAVGFDWATGDSNPADGDLETWDQLFPTAHRHLGTMDYVGRQNIRDLRGQLGARLTSRITGLVDFHHFRLDRPEDAWYNTAGEVTQAGVRVFGPDPSRTETELGQEVDLLLRFVGFAGAAIEGGYSRFFAGDVLGEGGAPQDDSDWAYIQVKVDL
jgi:hypothetical protein